MTRRLPPEHLRFEIEPPVPSLALAQEQTVEYYIPLVGTYGLRDQYAEDDQSPFVVTLRRQGFYPLRDRRGRPYRWFPGLSGESWSIGADAIFYLTDPLPFHLRNFILYSNAGQAMWIALASGLEVRSITLVGTPNRSDVPSAAGIKRARTAQLIFDAHVDPIATLGGWFDGDGVVLTDRAFTHLGDRLKRYPLPGIGHGGVLHEPRHIARWETEPWLDNIRAA